MPEKVAQVAASGKRCETIQVLEIIDGEEPVYPPGEA